MNETVELDKFIEDFNADLRRLFKMQIADGAKEPELAEIATAFGAALRDPKTAAKFNSIVPGWQQRLMVRRLTEIAVEVGIHLGENQ